MLEKRGTRPVPNPQPIHNFHLRENVLGLDMNILQSLIDTKRVYPSREVEASIGRYSENLTPDEKTEVLKEVFNLYTPQGISYNGYRAVLSKYFAKGQSSFHPGVSALEFQHIQSFLGKVAPQKEQKETLVEILSLPTAARSLRTFKMPGGTELYELKERVDIYDHHQSGIRVRTSNEIPLDVVAFASEHSMMLANGALPHQRRRFRTSYSTTSDSGLLKKGFNVDLTRVITQDENQQRESFEVEIEINSHEATLQDFVYMIHLVYGIMNNTAVEYIRYLNNDIPEVHIPDLYERMYVAYRFGRCFNDSLPFSQHQPRPTFQAKYNRPINLRREYFIKNATEEEIEGGKKIKNYAKTIHDPMVTVKVDGKRGFVISIDSGVYVCFLPSMMVKIASPLPENNELLLDCEVVETTSGTAEISTRHFAVLPVTSYDILIFDIIASSKLDAEASSSSSVFRSRIGSDNYVNYRFRSFKDRLDALLGLKRDQRGDSSLNPIVWDLVKNHKLHSGYFLLIKPYFTSPDNFYERIQNAFGTLTTDGRVNIGGRFYEQDGIILQNSTSKYYNQETFKWKPHDLTTIDFLFKRVPFATNTAQFYLYVFDEHQKSLVPFKRPGYYDFVYETLDFTVTIGDTTHVTEHLDGKIIECKWDGERFVPYRMRDDKLSPNKLSVAIDNFNDMIRPISPETLMGRTNELLRDLHNDLKRERIIRTYEVDANSPFNLIDIGSGRGGDMSKWCHLYNRANNVNHPRAFGGVYCIEPNTDNVNEFRRRLDSTIISDDCKRTIHILQEEGQSSILSERLYGVQGSITAFFSLTFFFESESILDALIDNIDQIVGEKGCFSGIVFDGQRVESLLEESGGNFTSSNFSVRYSLSDDLGRYGRKIITSLHDDNSMVKDVHEYLFDFEIFYQKMRAKGFSLVGDAYLQGEYLCKCPSSHTWKLSQGSCPECPLPSQPIKCVPDATNNRYRNLPADGVLFSSLNRSFCFIRDGFVQESGLQPKFVPRSESIPEECVKYTHLLPKIPSIAPAVLTHIPANDILKVLYEKRNNQPKKAGELFPRRVKELISELKKGYVSNLSSPSAKTIKKDDLVAITQEGIKFFEDSLPLTLSRMEISVYDEKVIYDILRGIEKNAGISFDGLRELLDTDDGMAYIRELVAKGEIVIEQLLQFLKTKEYIRFARGRGRHMHATPLGKEKILDYERNQRNVVTVALREPDVIIEAPQDAPLVINNNVIKQLILTKYSFLIKNVQGPIKNRSIKNNQYLEFDQRAGLPKLFVRAGRNGQSYEVEWIDKALAKMANVKLEGMDEPIKQREYSPEHINVNHPDFQAAYKDSLSSSSGLIDDE